MRKEQIPLIERSDLHHRNQVLTVAGVTMALFATGNIMGYSSFTISELLDPDSIIKVTHGDLSWIASLVSVGCIFGALLGGIVSDLIGRKKAILLASLVFFIGWVTIARAKTVRDILIGRVLTGLASGSYSSAVQVYISEIVEPSIRGIAGAFPTLMVSIGILSIYCIGGSVTWWKAAWICSGFPIFVFVYTLCVPESPVWLIGKGKQVEALKSLAWLRNNPYEAEQECLRLEYLKERRQRHGHFSIFHCLKVFSTARVLKPLIIGIFLFFFQQFSGIYPIIFYATLIFQYANNFMDDSLQTIAIGVVRTFSTFIALFLVKFLPRKTLLIVSGLFMSVSTGILGVYFRMRENLNESQNTTMSEDHVQFYGVDVDWLPLVCLLLYMFFYSIGFGIIPWFLITEISPSDVRGVSSAISIGFCQIYQFATVKTFLNFIDWFDTFGAFWIYSGISILSVIFVGIFVPETSHLNAGQIEAIFDSTDSIDENGVPIRSRRRENSKVRFEIDDEDDTTGF